MSITFRVAGELLGEVPIEAFDALYGFDALLEEKQENTLTCMEEPSYTKTT